MLTLYTEAKEKFETDSKDINNIIWYGRRTAYLGKYTEAIDIYTEGIKTYPDEPRLYRHRGHRCVIVAEGALGHDKLGAKYVGSMDARRETVY